MQGFSGIKALYRESIKCFGATSHGVLWSNEIEQMRRFEICMDLLGINCKEAISINDFGCGYGALFEFLMNRQVPVAHYYGYDMLPEMLEVARRYIDLEKYSCVELILSQYPTKEAQYTIISGTFNLCDGVDRQEWKQYICERLLLAFSHSTQALVFNGLSPNKAFGGEGLFYCEKEEFLEFCEYGLNARVKSYDDPLLQEWSIALFKDEMLRDDQR